MRIIRRLLSTKRVSLPKDGPSFQDFIDIARTGNERMRLAPWLRAPKNTLTAHETEVSRSLKKVKLATVCEEARCPNISECWGTKEGTVGTATIMLLGDTCTRGCRFCSVKTSRSPPKPDENEPLNTAIAIKDFGVEYIVITSVDRDDMQDMGANHIAKTIKEIRRLSPGILVECLAPDFKGKRPLIEAVVTSGLQVFAHNVETVERLQKRVRDPRAGYQQSLKVLQTAKDLLPSMITKTSLMLGLGETDDEILQTLKDLRDIDVDCITFGQYLQPTKRHLRVEKFVSPKKFDHWKSVADEMGFLYSASGPYVRSSYKAGEYYLSNIIKKRNAAQKS